MANTLVVVSDIQKYLDLTPSIKTWTSLNIQLIISNLINFILTASIVVFLFFLLLGGIQWITSGGDKESLAKAKGKITSAIIGLIIVFSAWAILSLVKGLFLPWPKSSSSTTLSPEKAKITLPSLDECRNQICQEKGYVCSPGYNLGTCYKSCRCICDAAGRKWAYENPWCDADGHQYVCLGGSRVLDDGGSQSGIKLPNCP